MSYKYEIYKEICAIERCCNNYKHEVEGFRAFNDKSPIRWLYYITESAKRLENLISEKENMEEGE